MDKATVQFLKVDGLPEGLEVAKVFRAHLEPSDTFEDTEVWEICTVDPIDVYENLGTWN